MLAVVGRRRWLPDLRRVRSYGLQQLRRNRYGSAHSDSDLGEASEAAVVRLLRWGVGRFGATVCVSIFPSSSEIVSVIYNLMVYILFIVGRYRDGR